jgi:thioredoxin-like negative regulator of GroEL
MEKTRKVRYLAVAGAFLATISTAVPSIPAAFKNVEHGQPPPAFTLKGLDGAERTSGDLLKDRVSVILLWATWSPRSLEVLVDLEKLVQELGPEKLQVIAINAEHQQISRSDEDIIAGAIKKAGSSALVLIDDGLVAFSAYGTMALPSMIVIDEGGKVSFTMAGYPTTMREDLTQAVKMALGIITEEDAAVVEEYVPKNHALMYYNMGKRLYEKGQEEKAEAQLLDSVERDPAFIKPHILLGLYYKKEGRHEDALKEFERVKELDPRDHEAGYQAAAITLRAKKFSEAQQLFGELNTEYPEKEEFALGLALAYKYQGNEGDYRKVLDSAGDLYPAEARYYYDMGGVAESSEDLAEAAVFYRKALEKAFQTRKRP